MDWCLLEAQSCCVSSLPALTYSSFPICFSKFTSNLVVISTLIQFKTFHRLHFSKAKLSEIYPDVDNRCNQSGKSPANLTHVSIMYKTGKFLDVFVALSGVVTGHLNPPHMAIIGVPEIMNLLAMSTDANTVGFATLLARSRILVCLKSLTSRSVAQRCHVFPVSASCPVCIHFSVYIHSTLSRSNYLLFIFRFFCL